MALPLPRVIAVDWSGAATRAERKIWVAECIPDAGGGSGTRVVRLESGRSREAVVAHLLEAFARDPNTVVGLDFSFSLPAWFLARHGAASVADAWELVAREGERWLSECAPPFWGRPGRRRPPREDGHDDLRDTERALAPVMGVRPKSTLQVGGAGAVGTGSLRGIPHLRALRRAGGAIWPFDPPALPSAPLVIELYPRLMTGAVIKSSAPARASYLAREHPSLSPDVRASATASEDAFDAICSALGMARVAASFARLTVAADPTVRLEGSIWIPPAVGPAID